MLPTMAGFFPLVSTELTGKDILGGWRMRWGIGRMGYKINPGLYGVGKPDSSSVVLVTANYKLSFDRLRKNLAGLNAWILVLDTKGINVWCAAGKGTFGTEELVRRIQSVNLRSIVKHGTVILPQLGAPGVASHTVAKETGFKVLYGPVRAADIPAYLANNCKTSGQMRIVSFTLAERLAVTPVEVVQSWKVVFGALLFQLLVQIIGRSFFSLSMLMGFLPYAGAILLGCVATPALLPWIPGRSFALKGWLLGFIATLGYNRLFHQEPAIFVSNLFILPAVSSYLALNFTGCSTYTSLSGVKKEMKIALPLLIFSAFCGILLSLYNAWRAG